MAYTALIAHYLLLSLPTAFSVRTLFDDLSDNATLDSVDGALDESIEDVRANSQPGELGYLHWAISSITQTVEKVAECKGAAMFGSCPYQKERDLIPMFVIGGQCPGSKCGEKQAMLYAMPEESHDKESVTDFWTWNTVGGSGPPCSRDASFPTRHLNPCGDSKNAPSDNMVISVKKQYLKLLDQFSIGSYNDAPRFVFEVDGLHLYLVALVVEEVTWGTLSPNKFKGQLLYQDSSAEMALVYQDCTLHADTMAVNLSGAKHASVHTAFLDSEKH